MAFFGHILELYVTFLSFVGTVWVFWAFYAVLSQIRFVIIYALFWVKIFWLKPYLCKTVVFFHLCTTVLSCYSHETFTVLYHKSASYYTVVEWYSYIIVPCTIV